MHSRSTEWTDAPSPHPSPSLTQSPHRRKKRRLRCRLLPKYPPGNLDWFPSLITFQESRGLFLARLISCLPKSLYLLWFPAALMHQFDAPIPSRWPLHHPAEHRTGGATMAAAIRGRRLADSASKATGSLQRNSFDPNFHVSSVLTPPATLVPTWRRPWIWATWMDLFVSWTTHSCTFLSDSYLYDHVLLTGRSVNYLLYIIFTNFYTVICCCLTSLYSTRTCLSLTCDSESATAASQPI
jgi:hypothetical protein